MSKLLGLVGAVLIVSFVAFAFVPVIDNAAGNTSTTETIAAGNTEAVTDGLNVTVDDSTADDVSVTVVDTKTGERVSQTIEAGETASFEFDNANATVTVTADQTTADSATLTVEYPRTFGSSSVTGWLASNMPLLLVILTFICLMAAMQVVIRG